MVPRPVKKQLNKSAAPPAAASLHKARAPQVAAASAGVVAAFVQKRPGKAASALLNTSRLIEELRAGLPVAELEDLQSTLGVPMEKLSSMLGISKSTLHRRRLARHLTTEESDRVVRFARLMNRAQQALESADNARRWLSAPQVGLGGATPLEFAETEVGAREVEDLLGRIEYSVVS